MPLHLSLQRETETETERQTHYYIFVGGKAVFISTCGGRRWWWLRRVHHHSLPLSSVLPLFASSGLFMNPRAPGRCCSQRRFFLPHDGFSTQPDDAGGTINRIPGAYQSHASAGIACQPSLYDTFLITIYIICYSISRNSLSKFLHIVFDHDRIEYNSSRVGVILQGWLSSVVCRLSPILQVGLFLKKVTSFPRISIS